MLVLSRKVNERIVIGDVVITVVDLGRGKCRIGVEAPDTMPIHRAEPVRPANVGAGVFMR